MIFIHAFEKRLKSPNMVREYAGTKLTSALCTINGLVIVTPTQYELDVAKLTHTVTDGASNFSKAFTEF